LLEGLALGLGNVVVLHVDVFKLAVSREDHIGEELLDAIIVQEI